MCDVANQLTEIRQGGTTLTTLAYDANGNLITRVDGGTTASFTYDALNRLVEAGVTGQPTHGQSPTRCGREWPP